MLVCAVDGGTRITLSGSADASGSTASVTGPNVTVTVPVGNSGKIDAANVAIGNTGSLQWRKNAGAYADPGSTPQYTFVSGDTLTFKSTGMTSPENDTCDLFDHDTGLLITVVSISRT